MQKRKCEGNVFCYSHKISYNLIIICIYNDQNCLKLEIYIVSTKQKMPGLADEKTSFK